MCQLTGSLVFAVPFEKLVAEDASIRDFRRLSFFMNDLPLIRALKSSQMPAEFLQHFFRRIVDVNEAGEAAPLECDAQV